MGEMLAWPLPWVAQDELAAMRASPSFDRGGSMSSLCWHSDRMQPRCIVVSKRSQTEFLVFWKDFGGYGRWTPKWCPRACLAPRVSTSEGPPSDDGIVTSALGLALGAPATCAHVL